MSVENGSEVALMIVRYSTEAFEAIAQLPENADRLLELIGGEIVEVVSNPKSSEIAMRIGFFIQLHLRQHKIRGHVTGADGGYMVAGERYIPDVAYLSTARQPDLPSMQGYNPIAPDLAVEVLSPTNADDKMRIKIAHYLLAGTIVWVVNPDNQTVETYIPGERVRIIDRDGLLDGGTVLPGFSLPVQEIFQTEEDQ
ncbi:Uma2 family endonuclease [bacterium]|nr:Uma2 family endonuclease [bacterium]